MEIPVSLLEHSIRRGTILHSTFFEEIGHGKFFAVMGISQDSVAGFFFINSNIHPAIFGKPEQLALQYPLKKEHYSFLKYDSFLCATKHRHMLPKQTCRKHTLWQDLCQRRFEGTGLVANPLPRAPIRTVQQDRKTVLFLLSLNHSFFLYSPYSRFIASCFRL